MAKKKDKVIVSGVDSFTVSILDNGFTIEYSGYNKDEDWVSRKLVIPTNDELHSKIDDIIEESINGND